MQATSRPWSWTGWSSSSSTAGAAGATGRRRRVRVQLQALPLDLRRLPPLPLDWRLRPDIAAQIYPGQQIRHLIRWESALGPSASMQPPFGFPRDPSFPWILHDIANRISLEPRSSAPAPRASSTAGGGSWWEGAGRGLPLGAALLAALLLLVRLADKCFANNLFNKFPGRIRRQSEEWPTPNVMATSLAVRITGEGDGDVENSACAPAPPPTSRAAPDPPPPYSECTAAPTASDVTTSSSLRGDSRLFVNLMKLEEPPPPYSACYVPYADERDGDATGAGARERHTVRLYLDDGRMLQVNELDHSEPEFDTTFGATSRSTRPALDDPREESAGSHFSDEPRVNLRVNLPEISGERFLLV